MPRWPQLWFITNVAMSGGSRYPVRSGPAMRQQQPAPTYSDADRSNN
jgi:hypothetical protein